MNGWAVLSFGSAEHESEGELLGMHSVLDYVSPDEFNSGNHA
jgi:hypothetical protein